MEVIKKEKGRLPYGIYSKKHNRLNTFLFLIWIIIYLLLIIAIRNSHHFWLFFILISLFMVFVLVYMVNKVNPLNIINRKAMLEMKIEEGINQLIELLKNNLHSESRIQVQLFCTNLLIDYDLEKARKLFNGIDKPKTNAVLQIYYMIEISLLISMHNYQEANIKIEEFKNNFSKLIKQYNSFKLVVEVMATKKKIDNIQEIKLINTKIKFLNVENAGLLAKYYYLRDKKEEGEKYANFVKENGKQLNDLYNEICEMYK